MKRVLQIGAVMMAVALLVAATALPGRAAEEEGEGQLNVLLFVGGEIHDYKGIGKVVEQTLKDYGRFEVTKVEQDLNALKAEKLKPYDVVVFYYTVGAINDEQLKGITEFVKSGRGFVTFHSGADSFRDNKAWHDFVGGHFIGHPAYQPFPVKVVDKEHPVMQGIGDFKITDEQYLLDYNKDKIRVLATGPGQKEGDPPMPAIWTQPFGEGRVFYMGFGHDDKAASDPTFKKLIARATLWAAGQKNLEPAK